MLKRRLFCFAVGAVFGVIMPVGAYAATTVWVAANGATGAACGAQATPCNNFQDAINNVVSGGTVYVASSGNYGAVSIIKPVSIINESGASANISMTTGSIAVMVNTAGNVTLVGINIDGGGSVMLGIAVNAVGNLTIERCRVTRFTSSAINLPSSTTTYTVAIINTLLKDNHEGLIVSQYAKTKTYLTRSTVTGNSYGIWTGVPIYSYGDNNVFGNTTDIIGTINTIAHN